MNIYIVSPFTLRLLDFLLVPLEFRSPCAPSIKSQSGLLGMSLIHCDMPHIFSGLFLLFVLAAFSSSCVAGIQRAAVSPFETGAPSESVQTSQFALKEAQELRLGLQRDLLFSRFDLIRTSHDPLRCGTMWWLLAARHQSCELGL